jgi:hypothetical protein
MNLVGLQDILLNTYGGNQMNKQLFFIIAVLFLASSVAPGDSVFYYQGFDGGHGLASRGLSAAAADLFVDEFNGPEINRDASIHLVRPRFTLSANPGQLRLIMPGTAFFDHWAGNDAAPALYVPAPAGDWTMTTRARLVQPAQGGFFQTGLIVRFGQFDLFYWGIYRQEQPTELRLERTGIKNLTSVNLGASGNPDVELRIVKEGSNYSFSYRFPPGEEWILAGSQTSTQAPQFLGLNGKSWVATNLIVDFDYLRIEK